MRNERALLMVAAAKIADSGMPACAMSRISLKVS
jgi:hypothetical protein